MVNRYNIRKYRIVSIWPIEILLIEIIAYPTFFRIVRRFIERNSTIRTFQTTYKHLPSVSVYRRREHATTHPMMARRHGPKPFR